MLKINFLKIKKKIFYFNIFLIKIFFYGKTNRALTETHPAHFSIPQHCTALNLVETSPSFVRFVLLFCLFKNSENRKSKPTNQNSLREKLFSFFWVLNNTHWRKKSWRLLDALLVSVPPLMMSGLNLVFSTFLSFYSLCSFLCYALFVSEVNG